MLEADASTKLLEAMIDSTAHRGPDGQGVWHDRDAGIGLAHRRLAIIDLSAAGHQPMLSDCGRFVMTYNGEIYNHLELRRMLEDAKAVCNWRGHSDTETLLAAIDHWGLDECLKRCAGMFALAVWDRKERRLSLARDRLGEKPLYWGWAGSAFVFGSELKALQVHPEFSGVVSREALTQYLRFGYVPCPHSIYEGVYKLEPGTILEVRRTAPRQRCRTPLRPGDRYESLSVRQYWSLNEQVEAGAANPVEDEKNAVELLEATLLDAVSRQTISDVPLGAFLSGGVDSSTIVALMQAGSSRPVKTFTIGFDLPEFDESAHAAAVARHLGTDHHELRLTENDALDIVPQLPRLYDEPFADFSQIPTHLVCRAARAHATVALSGDGGDELFGGYNRYFLGPRVWKRLQHLPLKTTLSRAISALPISAWDQMGYILNVRKKGGDGISRLGNKANRVASSLKDVRTIDDFFRNVISQWTEPLELLPGVDHEPANFLDDPLPQAGVRDPATRMMVQDIRGYLTDDILCKVDRAAMGVSLETRAPFLDPDVVALSSRLPLDLKIRDNVGKWILRQVLYRHVPPHLIERPKVGFTIPIGLWLQGSLRDWAENLLAPDKLEAGGLLDPEPIRKAWAEHCSSRRDWSNRLWIILMLQSWRMEYDQL